MTTAIYPGSFDPVTVGHLDIIKRAAHLFDHVIVAVLVNMEKKPWFTIEERTDLDFAAQRDAKAIVKGLRAVSDFEYEFQMALTNRKLDDSIETVFLTSSAENMYLSSSIVKQVGLFGGDISPFVPACIKEDILDRCRKLPPRVMGAK